MEQLSKQTRKRLLALILACVGIGSMYIDCDATFTVVAVITAFIMFMESL